jgi:hypothetical protein
MKVKKEILKKKKEKKRKVNLAAKQARVLVE